MVDIDIISPDGKAGTIPEEDKVDALAQGYTIPGSGATPEVSSGPLTGEQIHEKPPEIEAEDSTHDPVTPLVNRKTGEEEYIPTAQVIGKLQEGTHSYPEYVKNIDVINPDGKAGSIPKEDLQQALNEGYTLTNPRAEAIAAKVHDLQNQGGLHTNVGEGNAFKSGLEDSIPFGEAAKDAVDKIYGIDKSVGSPREIEESAESLNNKEHLGSYLAGRIPGEIVSAIGTGGVAEEVSGAAKLQGLVKAAAEGAVFSAPEVAKAAINKDPKGAAEALILGVGTNLGLHALLSVPEALGKVANKLIPEAGEVAENELAQSQNRVMDTLKVPAAQREKFREDIVPLIKATGINETDNTLDKMVTKIQSLDQSGPEIGRMIKSLDEVEGKHELIQPAIKATKQEIEETLGSEYKSYNDAFKSKAENLDKLTSRADELNKIKDDAKLRLKESDDYKKKGITVDPEVRQGIIDDITSSDNELKQITKDTKSLRQQPLPKLTGETKQAYNALRPILEELSNVFKKPDLSFEDTQKLKKFVGDQTSFTDITNVGNVKKKAYMILRENLLKAEDQAAAKSGGAVATEGLQKERVKYALEQKFGKKIDAISAKEIGKTFFENIANTHLSHRATLAGVAAHTVGSALGAPHLAPIAIGATLLQNYGKGLLAKKGLSKAIKTLISESANPIVAITQDATHQLDLHITDRTKQLIRSFGTQAVEKAHDYHEESLGQYLPNGGVGLSKEQQLKQIQVMAHTSPEHLADHLGKITAPLRAEGLDAVADEYTQHQLRLMKVMQTAIPEDPTLQQAHPFAAQVTAKDIDPATEAKYKEILKIANDPTHLLDQVKQNTITPFKVAIAAAINPVVLQKMRDALVDEAMKSKPDTTYQNRLSIRILMGQNVDASTAQLPVIQGVAYGAAAPAAAPGGKGHGGHSASPKPMGAKQQETFKDSLLTESQKLQTKL